MSEKNSKETTDKKDEEVAAKNKDLQDLRGEVGILKKYIKSKVDKEAEDAYEKKRLSKNIKGLKGLQGLSGSLGQQKI
jgi:hypothetical protein